MSNLNNDNKFISVLQMYKIDFNNIFYSYKAIKEGHWLPEITTNLNASGSPGQNFTFT